LTVLRDRTSYTVDLHITDEVLDAETCTSKSQEEELKTEFGWRVDHHTTDAINTAVGLFSRLFGNRGKGSTEIALLNIIPVLEELSREDAKLPPIVAIERQYQLRRKLEIITSKLRSQLRRKAELMPISKIQEMDTYCLRDYIRRPGNDAAEKAGSRQQLMGVQRYQDFNTPENKFLVYFCHLLQLECAIYADNAHAQELKSLERSLKQFDWEATSKGVQRSPTFFMRPNYVLQQNPLYRSFYQAYLDFIHQRTLKEKIWSFRNYLLADLIYILLMAACLRFQSLSVSPLATLPGSVIPNGGRYLRNEATEPITVFLQNQVWEFSIKKPDIIKCDWLLCLTQHSLIDGTPKNLEIPIWTFWNPPSQPCLELGERYLSLNSFIVGIIFCWQRLPDEPLPSTSRLKLILLSNFIETNWLNAVDNLAQYLLKIANARIWDSR
ncbi:MAG: DUF2357 domain-containing protein, partial [Crinalium sp.]